MICEVKAHPLNVFCFNKLLQVIVGPLGCGKTWCMTTAINKNTTVSDEGCFCAVGHTQFTMYLNFHVIGFSLRI